MGCGAEISDWDDKAVQDSMAGKNTDFDPRILAEMMPQVREAIAQRCVELLRENVENAKNEIRGMLAQEKREPTEIEKVDSNIEPTEKEYQEMYRVGEELGIRRGEIIDMPAITGIKDPEEIITQTETMRAIDKGEIKLGDVDHLLNQIEQRASKNHIDLDTMRLLTRETLKFLRESKIPSEFRDQATVNMIVFVDKQEPGQTKGHIAVEKAVKPEELQKTDPKTLKRSRNLYIFQSGWELVPKTEKERKEFHWKIAHGICHINDAREGRFDSRIQEERQDEWIKACESQLKAGVIDKEPGKEEVPYSLSDLDPEVRDSPEIVGHGKEFRAQHFAAWATDSPKLCPEMKEFFDRYFKE